MEMQLYPPGNAPFVDSESCDATHWCAALTIDSFTGTPHPDANPACQEPVNFAFIQQNGVPTGPPSPQDADTSTFVPNASTLLMNPGDTISTHMSDAPAPGGGEAFEVIINDLTTHKTGFMQASAANGFMTTSPADCSGTPFNFQPEYNTAGQGQHHPLGRDHGRHQHRVRDRALRGVHLARRPAPELPRPERHGRELRRVRGSVREFHHRGQQHR